MLSRMTFSKSGSISYPRLLRPRRMAACMVVPVPRKGSITVSSICENIQTSRQGISRGNAALLSREAAFCNFCLTPLTSHTSENQAFLSSQKKALFILFILSFSSLYIRLPPLRKTNTHSCSIVTYAPHGSIPLPINLLGVFVCLRQMMLGSPTNPMFRSAVDMRAWLLNKVKFPLKVRVASPMFTHKNPPSFSTL